MMETNSASCGGFKGVSDTFGVLLWAIDYALNMAAGSFSKALFHVGGSSDYYNVCSLMPYRISTADGHLGFHPTCYEPNAVPVLDSWLDVLRPACYRRSLELR